MGEDQDVQESWIIEEHVGTTEYGEVLVQFEVVLTRAGAVDRIFAQQMLRVPDWRPEVVSTPWPIGEEVDVPLAVEGPLDAARTLDRVQAAVQRRRRDGDPEAVALYTVPPAEVLGAAVEEIP